MHSLELCNNQFLPCAMEIFTGYCLFDLLYLVATSRLLFILKDHFLPYSIVFQFIVTATPSMKTLCTDKWFYYACFSLTKGGVASTCCAIASTRRTRVYS